MLTAQRFEAAERRIKEEIKRRGVQQRACKGEREAAQINYIARVIAKKHLEGLRDVAI